MLKTKRPPEAPNDPNPVSRLEKVLVQEGFRKLHEEDAWTVLGETVWARAEKVLFLEGETVVLLIHHADVDETILDQATRGIIELFRARGGARRALSVFQTTTVYVCLVAERGAQTPAVLSEFIIAAGGVVIVPVIVIPDHNTVIYPDVSFERKISPIRTRVEYLQFLLGELGEPVEIHRQTVQAFWLSIAMAGLLAVLAILAAVS